MPGTSKQLTSYEVEGVTQALLNDGWDKEFIDRVRDQLAVRGPDRVALIEDMLKKAVEVPVVETPPTSNVWAFSAAKPSTTGGEFQVLAPTPEAAIRRFREVKGEEYEIHRMANHGAVYL